MTYSLDQYALKFRYRAQANRRVFIGRIRNQAGDEEVVAVIPATRQLVVSHELAVCQTDSLMPHVYCQGQDLDLF